MKKEDISKTSKNQLSQDMGQLKSRLPKGWEVKKLGDVCIVQRGLTYSGHDTVDISENVVLRATNIDLITSSLIFDELKYLKDDFEIKEQYKLKKDSLLICFSSGSKSHLGKVAFVDKDYNYSFGGFIGQVTPNGKIYPEFLLYCMISDNYKKYILTLTDGVNINNLKMNDLQAFKIPLPPLSEQKRIVAILDKAFTAIDQAKANAEKNLQNAKDIFESYLQSVFENRGEGWEEKKLGEVCVKITDGSHFSPTTYSDREYPYITVRDIDNDVINFSNCKFISEVDYQILFKNGCKPKLGDLLFSKDGTVGKVSLIDYEKDFVVLSSLAIISPNNEIILSSLLKYVLKNPEFLKVAIGMKTGVAIRRIILKNLKQITIKFPKSKVNQQQIVQKLDTLSSQTQKLESIYQQKIANLDELKKSILHKAFNGELT